MFSVRAVVAPTEDKVAATEGVQDVCLGSNAAAEKDIGIGLTQ